MSETVDRLWAAMTRTATECIRELAMDAFATLPQRFDQATPNPLAVPKSRPVVDEWLDASIAAAPDPWRELAELLGAASADLPWLKSYEHLDPPPDFQARYSFVLLGAEAFRQYQPCVLLEDALVGFTLQAPHVFYPAHHHKPVEMYGVISGAVEWQVGSEWSTKGPGDVIVHRSHESHAMRSGSEPVLTWAIWPSDPETHVYMPSLDPPDHTMAPIIY